MRMIVHSFKVLFSHSARKGNAMRTNREWDPISVDDTRQEDGDLLPHEVNFGRNGGFFAFPEISMGHEEGLPLRWDSVDEERGRIFFGKKNE